MAVAYIKSSLILDIVATLPQVVSAMDVRFVYLKNIRVIHQDLMHYPIEELIQCCLTKRSRFYISSLMYCVNAVFKILVLLQYLGCGWIFVGSDYFVDFEEDLVPWTIANEDFHDMSHLDLMIFATYYVCTVITCVGYG